MYNNLYIWKDFQKKSWRILISFSVWNRDCEQFWFWISVFRFSKKDTNIWQISKFCLDVWPGRFCLLVAFLENPNFNPDQMFFHDHVYYRSRLPWQKAEEGRQHSCIQSQELRRNLFLEVFTQKIFWENTFVWALLLSSFVFMQNIVYRMLSKLNILR